MGLDNGLYIHTKKNLEKIEKPSWLQLEKWEDDGAESPYWEVCYWRRNYSVQKLGREVFQNLDDCKPDELREFVEGLCDCLKGKREWDCSWDLEECFYRTAYHIAAISWLVEWLENEPNARVEFVDSY